MGILVNGNGNPHVYAHQDSDLIAGIVGNQTSIMPVGDKFEANQEDANTIALSSGVIITKEGRRIQLDADTIDEFIIPTGAQDVQSFYIIGYHLYEDGNSDQLCETFVRKMDSASDTIPESTFRSGATEVFVSLYRVTQDSLNITDIDLLLPYADSIAEVKRNGGNKNLAAIEDGSTASQPYVKGEFVIVGGQFCEVTASISTNDAFIAYPLPNYNIKAGTVGEQITALNQNLTQILNPEYVEVTGNGVKTYAQLFNELYALVDISKVTNHSYLMCTLASGDKLFYRLKSFRINNTLEYEASMIASGKLCVDVLEIDTDSNYSRKVEGQNIAYITTTVVPNGEKYRLYYA